MTVVFQRSKSPPAHCEGYLVNILTFNTSNDRPSFPTKRRRNQFKHLFWIQYFHHTNHDRNDLRIWFTGVPKTKNMSMINQFFVPFQSKLHMEGFRSLKEGEAVEFTFKKSSKGLESLRVTGPGGIHCVGSERRPKGKKVQKWRSKGDRWAETHWKKRKEWCWIIFDFEWANWFLKLLSNCQQFETIQTSLKL